MKLVYLVPPGQGKRKEFLRGRKQKVQANPERNYRLFSQSEEKKKKERKKERKKQVTSVSKEKLYKRDTESRRLEVRSLKTRK